MKTIRNILILLCSITFWACEPTLDIPFEKYTVPKGKHYSTYKVELLQNDYLAFQAQFDESAIYTSVTPENQWDINKLFGLSDCNSQHHENSARFGWRWLEGKIEILAYCYVGGTRIVENIGATMPFQVNNYEIQLTDSLYIFRMDDSTISIERQKPCDVGGYYLLFPYFGGDETAPHDTNIYIKRSY